MVTNLTNRTKCNVYFETKKPSLTEAITTAMSNNSSMFATDDPDSNVRYIGKDPSNYVYFNCSDYSNQFDSTCEKWKIIGVFNNVTKSDGSKEKLVKIIRADSLGEYLWDYKKNGVGTSISDDEDYDWGSNDWSDSQLMMMLNPSNYLKSGYKISGDVVLDTNNQEIYSKMGSYYNGTKGCPSAEVASGASFICTEVDFTSTGLKNDTTRNTIEEVIWNLGGTSAYNTSTANMFYTAERGTTVFSGHETTWIGKIGLMYPSDYGYATSGGATTNRSVCLSKELYNWDSSGFSDCKGNDYLYNSSNLQWIMLPNSAYAYGVFAVNSTGYVNIRHTYNTYLVRPIIFLKSNIVVKSGTGESSNPYQLKLGIA